MILHIGLKAVSSHIFLWPTESMWHCAWLWKASFLMTNRKWVTSLHFLWNAVSSHLLFNLLWPWTDCEQCYFFFERQIPQIFSMTYRMWVTFLILWMEFLSYAFLYIFSDDQQVVSGIAHSVKGSLITSFPITNSEWATLHILSKAVSPYLFSYDQQIVSNIAHLWMTVPSHHVLWPTASEWYCMFCERNLITSFSMTNSLWVTLQILWKVTTSSHHLYDQQQVSDIAHLWGTISSQLFLWPTASGWHCTFCERQSHSHHFVYD